MRRSRESLGEGMCVWWGGGGSLTPGVEICAVEYGQYPTSCTTEYSRPDVYTIVLMGTLEARA